MFIFTDVPADRDASVRGVRISCKGGISVAAPTETFPSPRAIELKYALVLLILKQINSKVATVASHSNI